MVDLEGGEVLRQIAGHAGKVWHCALSGDGRRVASWAQAEHAISICDVASGERCLTLPAQGLEVQSLRLSNDGACLLSANHGLGAPCLSLWANDVAGPQRDFDAPGLGQAWDCALASAPGRVLSAHVDGLLCLWGLHSGALVDRITVPKVDGDWSACDIAADGRMALAGAQDRLVSWEIAAGTLRRTRPAAWGTGDVYGLSADAQRVVSGASDGQLMTWDLDPAHPPRLLQGHDRNALWSGAISADGRRALSASKGGHIVEWDLERARGPTRLPGTALGSTTL